MGRRARLRASTEEIAADAHTLAAGRRRIRRHVVDDRGTGLLAGGSFLIVAGAWLVLAPPPTVPVAVLVACVLTFVVAASVEFEIGASCALPTMPVQVVMLFLLPPVLVPPAVLLGLVGAAQTARVLEPERRERFLVLATSSWQVVGPAAVFAVAGVTGPQPSAIPVLIVAIAAQLAIEVVVSWFRSCRGLGVPAPQVARALGFAFLCDLALAPVGLSAAMAFPRSVAALLVLVPPILLLAMLQADRRAHVDRTVALGIAYTDTQDLARRDPLTGIANRLAFEEATARIRDCTAPVGVVLADVDGLKVANDDRGHHVGDALLVAIASVIASVALDHGASAFRIGGDEFVALLPDADDASTDWLGVAIRDAIEAAAPVADGVPVSASVGTGWAPSGLELSRALAAADAGASSEKSARGVRRR